MNFADMFFVSWEHEYFTDDDAAAFETLDEANAAADRLRLAGKRRVTVSGPGLADDDDLR